MHFCLNAKKTYIFLRLTFQVRLKSRIGSVSSARNVFIFDKFHLNLFHWNSFEFMKLGNVCHSADNLVFRLAKKRTWPTRRKFVITKIVCKSYFSSFQLRYFRTMNLEVKNKSPQNKEIKTKTTRRERKRKMLTPSELIHIRLLVVFPKAKNIISLLSVDFVLFLFTFFFVSHENESVFVDAVFHSKQVHKTSRLGFLFVFFNYSVFNLQLANIFAWFKRPSRVTFDHICS